LDGAGYDVTCFANANTCLSELERNGCHLLITDIKMPDMDGMALLSKVKHIAPWTPVIVISELGDIPMAVQAMKLGAADFMEKPLKGAVLINKVKEILSHSEFDCPVAALKLTKTEKKVLKLILGGYSNKEMALKMHCALRTIEFHRGHVFRKFGVNNAVELTKKAISMFSPGNGK
jgi:FixJ family two-component response regulator